MNPAATLGAYALGLAVVLGAGTGLGRLVGPVDVAPAETHGGDAGESAAPAAGPVPGGLSVAQDGYVLQLASPVLTAGQQTRFAFSVQGPDGALLQDYETTHERDLHLVVVRRDATGFQHVHPERDASGRWSVPLTLAEPGPYKVFADFQPEGRERPLVLAADVTVPGAYEPQPPPGTSGSATVDGYDVALDGELVAGTSSPLVLTVSKGGRPVTDLQPYLGAYGHLVALREGDLAYLHVHPDGEPGPGPDVPFAVEVPTAGAYRLFLDFQHGGTVRTAPLTATATAGSAGGDGGHDDEESHG